MIWCALNSGRMCNCNHGHFMLCLAGLDLVVSWSRGTPKSSTLMGFSILDQPFWMYGNPHLEDVGSCLCFSSDADRKGRPDFWHESKPHLAESFKEIMWPYPQQWHQNYRFATLAIESKSYWYINMSSRYFNDVPYSGFDRISPWICAYLGV